ncbi:MAG: putative YjbQ-like protein [uncultured marine phage]|uniref:Putative YjbQ-like protein n=1 Tax=uncultured marine phage TaxID=707152 RepID=A0A8D9CCX8_9VIRU|nr:MAG: putative YjbQ-like protein [uncultured marine phage]
MKKVIHLETDKLFTNLTPQIEAFAKEWGKSGLVNVFSRHTTCAIWLTEDEILHHTDVRFFLDAMAPKYKDPEGSQKNIKYLHDIISLREDVPVDERINGHSHIRHLFFNSSEMVPVENGELMLGDWKQIFAVELDPVRKRELIVTFISE